MRFGVSSMTTPTELSFIAPAWNVRGSFTGNKRPARRCRCMTAIAPRALGHTRGGGGRLTSRTDALGLIRRVTPADAAVWTAGVGFGLLLGALDAYARVWAAPLMLLAVASLGGLYVRLLGWRVGLLLL